MNHIIQKLQKQGKIWSAAHTELAADAIVDTGYPAMNQHLQGGLPRQGLIELQSLPGIGELRLILPYLRNLVQSEAARGHAKRQIVFIAPPAQLNALMFAEQSLPLEQLLLITSDNSHDALWAAEKCLNSGCCMAVLLWHQLFTVAQVRRLKQATSRGDAVQIVFRTKQSLDLALPVSVSLALSPHRQGLVVEIKKQVGGWPCPEFLVDMQEHWPCLTQTPRAHNVIPLSHTRVS